MASFSSRGPNLLLPEIIKPDVRAPGVDILAAYIPIASISCSQDDKRHLNYSILSGTSMSCLHAAGAAAYMKEVHPDWSPAAIKSSPMTTAWAINITNKNNAPGEFANGSGHINPIQAINLGLVYEAFKEDYKKLLCLVIGKEKVRLISRDNNTTCPTGSDTGSPWDHNYPSLAVVVTPMEPFSIKFERIVKNVGLPNSTYKANILATSTYKANFTQFNIKVLPQVLSLESLNEEIEDL
ncbi:putative cucumisin [Rosa chinensis]|uniref:Putative cucumisin n=1 Tax=Rosa chinensis TaxID=74649 RepID=A0A2P6S9K9_ROSCH|nr:subtilisin-like protease SBT4.4 [Rosa chinensis]PRQ55336.1 putative cucumisin [Rosa chinensis]